MVTDVTNRVLTAVEWLIENEKVQDKKALASELSVSTSMMTEMAKGRSNVGVVLLQNIVLKFGISAEWLLTGEGSMLKAEAPPEPPQQAESPIIGILRAQLAEKDRQIAQLLAIISNK